ncbi:uncharacterized protein CCOS01_17044 [Colletotrichum costaricense]|uniref:Uncharacterized protein n=1 Tax=Colletotrichum costaricense TaxID=1209916 RepID=A0AAJ0DRA8_9PEZI|nr:uncharacterized protein CCOS01_17044 [Colletotrichum costaricense]KAK1503186.1 hypothetical protein CCOS01_17044 [Colletotrichum costaricense]
MVEQNSRDAVSSPSDKGKGKEASTVPPSDVQTAPDDGTALHQQGDRNTPPNSSFASRLTASAASLSRSALTASSATETIRNGTTGAKVSPGTSSYSAQGSGSHRDTATYRSPSSANPGTATGFGSATGLSTAGGQQYEDFMDAQAQAVLDDPSQPQRSAEVQESNSGIVLVSEHTQHTPLSSGIKSDFQIQEANDGLGVVDLLNSLELDGFDVNDDDLQTHISPEEELSLKRALFDDAHGRTASNWTSLLDFQPHFLNGDDPSELLQHFGVADVQQARAMWMESWNDVLTSYTDEVWGDLGSLARQAHQEIEGARGDGTEATTGPDEMQALQRLRQILAHVRGR